MSKPLQIIWTTIKSVLNWRCRTGRGQLKYCRPFMVNDVVCKKKNPNTLFYIYYIFYKDTSSCAMIGW